MSKNTNKKTPLYPNRGVKIRGTTLLYTSLTANASSTSQQTCLKSLSDITVAPVVPTDRSAHCSQNELHTGWNDCLAPPGNSLSFLSRLLFLLKRILALKLCWYDNKIMSTCQVLLSTNLHFFLIPLFYPDSISNVSPPPRAFPVHNFRKFRYFPQIPANLDPKIQNEKNQKSAWQTTPSCV